MSGAASLAASLVASASAIASGTVGAVDASSAATAGPNIASVVMTAIPSAVASVLPSEVTTTAPVDSVALRVPVALELSAAFAGALAGGLVGVRRQLDVVGILTLAVAAGLGGGIMRDVLLQKYGVYALENPALLGSVLIAGFVAFFFFKVGERLGPVLFLVDAVSLGLFACIGADKALRADLAVLSALLIGTVTAVGGGVIRDLLTDEVPQVLRPGGLYATAAVFGTGLYIGLVTWLNVVKSVAIVAAVVLVVALRLLSRWLGWTSPMPTDLTPLVAEAPRRAYRRTRRLFGRGIERTEDADEPPRE